MKTTTTILFTIFSFLVTQSCNSKKPPLSKEGEVISRLQNDKNQPDYVRKGAEVMLTILTEKEHVSSRDYTNSKWKVTSVRSEAVVQAWIALLHSTEKKIPGLLPSAEEIDRENLESNKKNDGVIYYTTVNRLSIMGSCVSALTSLNMPEATSEVEAFIQRFEKKYNDSSGGKKMLELYRLERRQQEEDTRMGAAPWQVGPNPRGGCD